MPGPPGVRFGAGIGAVAVGVALRRVPSRVGGGVDPSAPSRVGVPGVVLGRVS